MKIPYIELFEYNFLLSLFDYFDNYFKDKTINGKEILVVQSYSDINIGYQVPALSIEILHRKNRSIGFGNYYGEIETEDNIIEIEGTNFEYRIQLNVYSSRRGENHKLSSMLDEALKLGESGIPLNTYHDNGDIKQANIGVIRYDYATDVKNNNMPPNIVTYNFHTIFEIKANSMQQYRTAYDYMELGNIIGKVKKSKN